MITYAHNKSSVNTGEQNVWPSYEDWLWLLLCLLDNSKPFLFLFSSEVLNGEPILPPGDIWLCLETFLMSWLEGGEMLLAFSG